MAVKNRKCTKKLNWPKSLEQLNGHRKKKNSCQKKNHFRFHSCSYEIVNVNMEIDSEIQLASARISANRMESKFGVEAIQCHRNRCGHLGKDIEQKHLCVSECTEHKYEQLRFSTINHFNRQKKNVELILSDALAKQSKPN